MRKGLIRDTKTGPVLQVLPVSPTTQLALHTSWVIFENKSEFFQASKTENQEREKSKIKINQIGKI